MKLPDIKQATTQEEARAMAINWQMEFSQESLSYGELCEHQASFHALAEKFDLIEEFKENGII